MTSSLVVQFMLGSELMGLAVSGYDYHNLTFKSEVQQSDVD
jgi:hypothetical protein